MPQNTKCWWENGGTRILMYSKRRVDYCKNNCCTENCLAPLNKTEHS